MALRDHTLDAKIVAAAKAEFLEHGYAKASLHKIAQQAGITTGALYTRYRNKDDLFCSLVKEVLEAVAKEFAPLQKNYVAAQQSRDVEALLAAIKEEESTYLDILFQHYEECVLFFCRSDGSSIGAALEKSMENKAKETVTFLHTLANKDLNLTGVELIMYEQFHYYRKILEKGFSKEDAIACMELVEVYIEAGWREIFKRILA